MRTRGERVALLCAMLLGTLVVVLAISVVGESHTWDEESDFEGGDYEACVWDSDREGITLWGKDGLWKYRGNPVVTEGTSGWDSSGVFSPCVVFADGKYHLYYTGYDGTDYAIGLARSSDGESFSKYGSSALLSKGPGTYDSSGCREPFVIYEDGVFKMWYTGLNGATESIAYATSTDGLSWTKYGSNPVLQQPTSGWGLIEFGDPSVIKVDGRYWMYLSGSQSSGNKEVGLAKSDDGISWSYHASNPIIQDAASGDFGSQEICDVAVVRNGALWEMYLSGSNGVGQPFKIGYAWSYNGVDWTVQKTVSVDTGHGTSFDNTQLRSPGCIWDGDTLMMYYAGDDGTDYGIGLVVRKPWFLKAKPPANPVLGTGSTYDFKYLQDPCVIKHPTAGNYLMYYTSWGGTGYKYSISKASSNNPITWGSSSKYTNNPVLENGTSSTWDDSAVFSPCVMIENGVYKMWYTGNQGTRDRIGYATSTDGNSWTKDSGNPVFANGSQDAWDGHSVRNAWVLKVGTTYHMFYQGKVTGSFWQIGHATSADGISWTRDAANPVFSLDAGTGWERTGLLQPTVLYESGRFVLYYSSPPLGTTKQRVGVAYSGDGSTWTRGTRNPILDIGNSTDWDDDGVALGSVLVEGVDRYVYFYGYNGSSWQIGLGSFNTSRAYYTTPVLDASSHWPVDWGTLMWDATVPLGTSLRFQVATNLGGSVWRFVGPDGTQDTFFEQSGRGIFEYQSGKYLRVRAFLETDDMASYYPVLRSLTVTYKQRDSPTPPAVTVTSPNGGEDWMKTKTYPITWTAVGNLNATSVDLAYSTDNGTTWTDIATRKPNAGHYKWTVPSTETSGALVRVQVRDVDGALASDVSDATFAIDPPPPKAGEFHAPAEGDVLAPGPHRAEWVVHDPWGLAQRPLSLELTTDGGATWSLVADGLELTEGLDWQVPALKGSSGRCRLRLSVLSWLGDISVIESGQFSVDIAPPRVPLVLVEGDLESGGEAVVTAEAEDDLSVLSAVVHVSGEDGERTYSMTTGEAGRWSATVPLLEGDGTIWVAVSDGAHETASQVVELDISRRASAAGDPSSLAWELLAAALVAVAATTVVALLAVARRRRGGQ